MITHLFNTLPAPLRTGIAKFRTRRISHSPKHILPVTSAPAAPLRSEAQSNPYLEARREWNERYGDYIKQAHHWRTIAIITSSIALVSSVGIGYIGAQSKVVPYVVEVDKLGLANAVNRADHPPEVDSRMVRSFLARFVSDWRTISPDRQAEHIFVNRVYSMLPSGSTAQQKLNDYFKAHNPFALGSKQTVSVAVTNLLPISASTWQVEWQETTRDGRGIVQSEERMKASILIVLKPPTDERQILLNPLGLYLKDINWSQQI